MQKYFKTLICAIFLWNCVTFSGALQCWNCLSETCSNPANDSFATKQDCPVKFQDSNIYGDTNSKSIGNEKLKYFVSKAYSTYNDGDPSVCIKVNVTTTLTVKTTTATLRSCILLYPNKDGCQTMKDLADGLGLIINDCHACDTDLCNSD